MTAKEKFEYKLKELKILERGSIGHDDYYECVDCVEIFYTLMYHRDTDEYKIYYFGCKEEEIYNNKKFLQAVGEEWIKYDWKFKSFLDWYNSGERKNNDLLFNVRHKNIAAKVVVTLKND